MKKAVLFCAVLGLFLSLRQASAATYEYTWSCNQQNCSFAANPVANAVSYYWQFGDGGTASGQTTSHTYGVPNGAGFYYPRVTLTYGLSDGTYRNVRCYIQYYFSGGVGGDPTPTDYSGTCSTFN